MRLHRSITSFMKITLNNYEVTSRMRSLIGVAELILEKSITIQISTFQSSSKATRTLQTLKVFPWLLEKAPMIPSVVAFCAFLIWWAGSEREPGEVADCVQPV